MVDNNKHIDEILKGAETSFINQYISSNLAYRPQFISNNYREGRKVLSSIENELLQCESFSISVAFITMSGITPLLQTLKELEAKGIRGRILTTDYLNFSEPKALEKLAQLKNITIKMFISDVAGEGFHTKGYIFKKEEVYRIIVGSSNMTLSALTKNREWNTKLISTEQGEIANEILNEYEELWNSKYSMYYKEFIDEYRIKYEIIKNQRKIASQQKITSVETYKLQPNSMQVGFISNLKKILEEEKDRALLISATGTGKTYASAFAMRELGFKKVLFLVHRNQIAKQAIKSFRKVFGGTVTMGIVSGTLGRADYDKDFIFATIQTFSKKEILDHFKKDHFDGIIYDEAHHTSAKSYKKVMDYFTPKFTLGMTATPDKRDDNIEGRNVYEIFNHQIAYEIRLQDAMEEDLLCPFHYFGITDLLLINDEKNKHSREEQIENFRYLTSDARVENVMRQAQYFGYSGDRVKGLMFCSRVDEAKELSKKFNERGLRTVVLTGGDSESVRADAIERLAGSNSDNALDYILSVDIFSEGVDVPEINQVIMLRPTQSPIIFIQQLGRGLRKAENKEYVVVLDFIGNYNNNFMIPIALSGDRTYNPDTIRKYIISGNNTIPGASTVHFDEISKDKIFASIDKIKGMKAIIKDSYVTLKNRIGRVPYLLDFYKNSEIDPLVIIKEYKTYQNFLEATEKELYFNKISEDEKVTLEYLSKTILSGTRPYEFEILKCLLKNDKVSLYQIKNDFKEKYGYEINLNSFKNAIEVLQGKFVSKEDELKKYCNIDIVSIREDDFLRRMNGFAKRLAHNEFYRQVEDIVEVGLNRYRDKYATKLSGDTPFVLYEKYSRRDVSLLMNCGRDLSSTMYGMKRINDDVFIFVTYHKESSDDKEYVDGKPDYADSFEDNMIFRWDSQIGRGIDSSYMADVTKAKRKHLLVKKSDAESNFYYVGEFDVVDIKADKKKDNKGKERDITKTKFKMHQAVREDLLRYLQSKIVS